MTARSFVVAPPGWAVVVADPRESEPGSFTLAGWVVTEAGLVLPGWALPRVGEVVTVQSLASLARPDSAPVRPEHIGVTVLAPGQALSHEEAHAMHAEVCQAWRAWLARVSR